MKETLWVGAPPTCCDLCNWKITDVFVDGRTIHRVWAILCLDCHKEVGVGLGTGKGQKYELQGGKWIKVEG